MFINLHRTLRAFFLNRAGNVAHPVKLFLLLLAYRLRFESLSSILEEAMKINK